MRPSCAFGGREVPTNDTHFPHISVPPRTPAIVPARSGQAGHPHRSGQASTFIHASSGTAYSLAETSVPNEIRAKLAAMDLTPDVRWKQRFQNFDRAFVLLRDALEEVSPP